MSCLIEFTVSQSVVDSLEVDLDVGRNLGIELGAQERLAGKRQLVLQVLSDRFG